jgi:hypothetical protein
MPTIKNMQTQHAFRSFWSSVSKITIKATAPTSGLNAMMDGLQRARSLPQQTNKK